MIRHWCAKFQFDGKQEFFAGTFTASHNATQHELEAAAWQLVDLILPVRPRLVGLLPGALFFNGDVDDDTRLDNHRNHQPG